MKRLMVAALFCTALAQAALQNGMPDTAANPKAVALSQAQYRNPVWLYDYDVPGDGKYSAKVFLQSINPLGGNWFSVVSEHKPKRKSAPVMRILDWVRCGGQPDSVMTALVLSSPKGQILQMADVHSAASPQDLDAATIKRIQDEDKNEPAHVKKMTDFVCKKAK